MNSLLASAKASLARFGKRLPVPPQTAAIAAAASLGMGGVIGIAVSPNLPFSNAAGTPVVQLPAEDEPALADTPADNGGGGGGGGGGSSTSPAPSTTPAPLATPPLAPPVDDPPYDPPNDPKDPKPDPTKLSAPVVHLNPVAGSYTLAKDGATYAVHADELPDPAAVVEVTLEALANETYEEKEPFAADGTAESATISGVVIDRDPQTSEYTLSDTGVSMRVQVPGGDGPEAQLPELSSSVTVDVDIEVKSMSPKKPSNRKGKRGRSEAEMRGETCRPDSRHPDPPAESLIILHQTALTVDFPSVSSASGAAVIQASCPEESELIISADDVNEAGRSMRLAVTDEIDLSVVEPGDPIVFRLDPDPGDDALFDLAGLGGDDGVDGAKDEEGLQGDYP